MDQRRVIALVDAQAAARDRLAAALAGALLRLWRSLTPAMRFDEAAVDEFARQAGQLGRQARGAVAGTTEAYLRAVLAEMDAAPRRVTPRVTGPARRVPDEVEFARPAAEFRRLRLAGLDELEASERAARRLVLIGQHDLALAQRDTSQRVLAAADKVIGWRRIPHPELSRGGTCGLCIAASDRVYARDELMPLHERCQCTVLPVTRDLDPGSALNQATLGQLYDAAGGTSASRLARTRFTVHEHGELGPVLRAAGNEFRGPGDVPAA